jgi:hypothetical protein
MGSEHTVAAHRSKVAVEGKDASQFSSFFRNICFLCRASILSVSSFNNYLIAAEVGIYFHKD